MDERISTANTHRWNMVNRWMKNKYWMLAVHIFCTVVNSHEIGILKTTILIPCCITVFVNFKPHASLYEYGRCLNYFRQAVGL